MTASHRIAPRSVALVDHDLPVLDSYRAVAALLVLRANVGYVSGAALTGPWAGWLARMDVAVAVFFRRRGGL